MGKPKDFAKLLVEQIKADEGFADDMDRERLNGEIAVLIYADREAAGLTQEQLAQRAGTHQSVIARLEDAEYNGRSVELLRRVLHALGRRLEVSSRPLSDDIATVDVLPFEKPKIYSPPPDSPIEIQRTAAQ